MTLGPLAVFGAILVAVGFVSHTSSGPSFGAATTGTGLGGSNVVTPPAISLLAPQPMAQPQLIQQAPAPAPALIVTPAPQFANPSSPTGLASTPYVAPAPAPIISQFSAPTVSGGQPAVIQVINTTQGTLTILTQGPPAAPTSVTVGSTGISKKTLL